MQPLRVYLAAEGVREVPVGGARCPPLFPVPMAVPADLARAESIASYFAARQENGGWTITDDYPLNEALHNRMPMLAAAYGAFLGDTSGATLLDLAGSNGYYSFHAARLGFGDVTCVDGRPEHGQQFEALRELAATPDVSFELADVEDLRPLRGRAFDVVVAQGIVHHLYDHLAFLRDAARLARRLLIVDTLVTGQLAPAAHLRQERMESSRSSPVAPISLTPSVTLLVALLRAAGCRELFHVPWPGRIRDAGGSVVDMYGYTSMHRIMLVARRG